MLTNCVTKQLNEHQQKYMEMNSNISKLTDQLYELTSTTITDMEHDILRLKEQGCNVARACTMRLKALLDNAAGNSSIAHPDSTASVALTSSAALDDKIIKENHTSNNSAHENVTNNNYEEEEEEEEADDSSNSSFESDESEEDGPEVSDEELQVNAVNQHESKMKSNSQPVGLSNASSATAASTKSNISNPNLLPGVKTTQKESYLKNRFASAAAVVQPTFTPSPNDFPIPIKNNLNSNSSNYPPKVPILNQSSNQSDTGSEAEDDIIGEVEIIEEELVSEDEERRRTEENYDFTIDTTSTNTSTVRSFSIPNVPNTNANQNVPILNNINTNISTGIGSIGTLSSWNNSPNDKSKSNKMVLPSLPSVSHANYTTMDKLMSIVQKKDNSIPNANSSNSLNAMENGITTLPSSNKDGTIPLSNKVDKQIPHRNGGGKVKSEGCSNSDSSSDWEHETNSNSTNEEDEEEEDKEEEIEIEERYGNKPKNIPLKPSDIMSMQTLSLKSNDEMKQSANTKPNLTRAVTTSSLVANYHLSRDNNYMLNRRLE